MTTVTQDGLERVEQYIQRFRDHDGAIARINVAMLNRLRDGHRTEVDLRYYEHELMESEIFPRFLAKYTESHQELSGAEPNGDELYCIEREAHLETLKQQGLGYYAGCGADLYHSEVILNHRAYFSAHTINRVLPLPLDED